MKISINKLDAEDLEVQNFVKFKSKKQKLTGKQSITQLVSQLANSDPNSKFANPDLNKLSKQGFLDATVHFARKACYTI